MADLFTTFNLSGLPLANRVIMAPMTRSRGPEDIADERVALYYAQRGTAGLIVTEGTPISNEGQGYLFNPGIFTPEQVAGWRLTTDSVRSVGGRMFTQLWHVGRISHESIQHDGRAPVGPSSLQAQAMTFGRDQNGVPGFVPAAAPRRLSFGEIARVIEDFAQAARNAVEAGFDGIELHGANGYLLDQFLNPAINDRDDHYGADTIENRIRFTLDVVDAVIAAIGKERVAIRLSPWGTVNDSAHYDELEATYLALGEALGAREIAYVHVMDQSGFFALPDTTTEPTTAVILRMLRNWRPFMPHTALMLAGNMTRARADQLIGEGVIDLAAFGQSFIANPDLVERLRHGWPLATPDRDTFYSGGAKGYIDYPPYQPQLAETIREAA